MSKFLDSNGLTSLWSKFKSFLTTWKTENFGTGTYSNKGKLAIGAYSSIDLSSTSMKVISGRENDATVYGIRIDATNTSYLPAFYGSSCIDVFVGMLTGSSETAMIKPHGDFLRKRYIIIGSKGIKTGEIPANSDTLVSITNVGAYGSPFICITTTYY